MTPLPALIRMAVVIPFLAPATSTAAQASRSGSYTVPIAGSAPAAFRRGPVSEAIGNLTLDLSLRAESNVFLTADHRVDDAILTVTPGWERRFGQDAQIGGRLSYQHSFTEYLGGTAPGADLASAGAEVGLTRGETRLTAVARYEQLYQNSRDTAAVAPGIVYRSDVSSARVSLDLPLGARTSLALAPTYSRVRYRSAGLVGTTEHGFPLEGRYQLTRKVDLSLGATARRVEATAGSSRDFDVDLGARGELTSLLSGQVSAGLRTRRADPFGRERMAGFDAALDYELSPRSAARLSLARGFDSSPTGESTRTTSLGVTVSTTFSPSWQAAGGLAYRRVGYGHPVFGPGSALAAPDRSDHYWEGRLSASYQATSWLQAGAEYLVVANRSTIPRARFTGNTLSLRVGLRY